MKTSKCVAQLILLSLTLTFSAVAPALASESDAYLVARGGRLYDKWFAENGATVPPVPNSAYPADGKYYGKKGADWRCKECHGWDYRGKEGAYKSGKHYTGIIGVTGAAERTPGQIEEILRSAPHGYSQEMLSTEDMTSLALFLTQGQVKMTEWIDESSKEAKGDPAVGQNHYEALCASCHGLDGQRGEVDLAKLSKKNPWEVLHKIRNGQPNSEMPALLSLGDRVAVDILTYLQSREKGH